MLDNGDKHIKNPVFRDIPLNYKEFKQYYFEQQYHELFFLRKDARKYEDDLGDVTMEMSDDESATSIITKKNKEITEVNEIDCDNEVENKSSDAIRSVNNEKNHSFLKRFIPELDHRHWTIFTAGGGVFSDSYISSAFSNVNVCLKRIYGTAYYESKAISVVSSINFAGTVFGMLFYGYLADTYGRKRAMLLGTSTLILFVILCAGAWGINTTDTHPGGLFEALAVYRFFIGISIGSEYSVNAAAAAEASNALPKESRSRYYIWFTDTTAVAGGIIAGCVPLVLTWICGEAHMTPIWRITVGLGAIAPCSFFIMRLKYKESEQFKTTKFKKIPPYGLIFKFYWFRTGMMSLLWFFFDFVAYSFATYLTIILDMILGDNPSLVQDFGWSIVFRLFSVPGAVYGAYLADMIGPRNAMAIFWFLEGIFSFIIAAEFTYLRSHLAGFIILYGLFTASSSFGPGCNISLLAAKMHPTPLRGQLYGFAAAVGKVGAFVGSYVFPIIIKKAGGSDTVTGLVTPFYISAGLCCGCGILTFFFMPPFDPESMIDEDNKFIQYLDSQGYDISNLGEAKSNEAKSNEDESNEDEISMVTLKNHENNELKKDRE
ncbi:hypothetical protein TPHA_0N01950 [Tetrapisispora phaffii CBS 4417]|uniref:Major facilitator superfamily (MFS) profile domain-containing protein n=1 Tax=Tetrapisispora phaffii (strain ATCC 24235 / CBS 4417 / NBRC 1672 / NRRL Y-8282 / UCD 70-5) TaxID=1071381 RepID=G8C1E8_TETPH|nr:hypothetical protein TPHA_0N01950 [Tetrapisispora phaffii CBS 4417]CCE65976.1 hypothetical protein TPHA_0N01950 [Tetrapisispora phaffii CBS 4417]